MNTNWMTCFLVCRRFAFRRFLTVSIETRVLILIYFSRRCYLLEKNHSQLSMWILRKKERWEQTSRKRSICSRLHATCPMMLLSFLGVYRSSAGLWSPKPNSRMWKNSSTGNKWSPTRKKRKRYPLTTCWCFLMYRYWHIHHFFWSVQKRICYPQGICSRCEHLCAHWQAEDSERREKNLEEAKKVVIENDPSLPEPKTVMSNLSL